MSSSTTLAYASNHIAKVFSSFEGIIPTLAAYRKLFVFAIGQFRKFSDHFNSIATNETLSKRQYCAYKTIITDCCKKYLELLQNYSFQHWTKNTLENKISELPSKIFTLTTSLQEHSAALDPIGSRYFNSADPEWKNLHYQELQSIYSSFESFIKKNTINNNITINALKRMNSISDFFSTNGTNNCYDSNLFSPIPHQFANYRLNHTDLIQEEQIGKGASAVVYSGIYKPTGEKVAIKRLNCEELNLQELQHYQNEITVLASNNHSSVISFIGATVSYPYCIVTKWMPNGNLFDALHKNNTMNPTDLTIALYDIARGLNCIHSNGYIHRDLKSPNILLDSENRIKICDFGISSISSDDEKPINKAGTAQWLAPEVFNGKYPVTEKVDVYSYAIIAYEAATGQIPFDGLDPQVIINHVVINDLRPHLPQLPNGVEALIKTCWATDPSDRPSFDDIVQLFKSGNIIFAGADRSAVLDYIHQNPI